jgi:hypothetical protein
MGIHKMSQNDDDRPRDDGVHQPTAHHRHRDSDRRRKQVVFGAIGLAAVLSAGAYAIAAQVTDHKNSTSDSAARAPMITPASAAPSHAAPQARASASPTPAGPTPSGSASVDARKAREKAAKDATADPHAQADPVSERSVARPAGGSLRIITAKFNLAGQRELLWAADRGKPVGDAHCTQNFRFGKNVPPTVYPNLLLCWRTSADRSVATVMVDQSGRPSAKESAQIINHEWTKLG